ncbi:hypothetical protein TNIN_214471 [Trichonephila inaurata madagascariensis]|uniref:Uncharacterized protein n=1 Tax=Trichonephila inaurata madagascariensis TaxID=2747483 RepID=A0A8X6Y7N3_9ARAC|nr:hypothetical protein TNIN_214471 [Trichonephila inaurata madagascariensis]
MTEEKCRKKLYKLWNCKTTSQTLQTIPYKSNEAFYRAHTPHWTSNKRKEDPRWNNAAERTTIATTPENRLKALKENRLFYIIDFS